MTSRPRPSADQLLEKLQEKDRARLRVYIGAAPGVGKTYSMLKDAHALRQRGIDVVIGLIETYGRADTQAQIGDLETIPKRRVPYKNVEIEEMDLDAILVRKPALCVVDELAHTNAPGSRHDKRYEDVIELLDHGISVMTAVNIQHLETLNDLVSRMTGVKVRETVPDTFLDRADEVINVDVTVDELRTRLRQGKVYKPEKVEQALTNFFREGNLSTLRELALRAVADEVGEKAASYRQREGLEPGLIPERVMVCMSSSASSPRVIRAGARIASRLGARWYAVYVETPAEVPARIKAADREQLAQNIALAEESRRHGRARDRRSPGGRTGRLRAARGDHPRHLRPELAQPRRDPDEGVHPQPVPGGGQGRGRAGRSAVDGRTFRRMMQAPMRLYLLDWAIVLFSLFICFFPALFFGKRAGKNTSEFFASGRSVPWWLAGLSMVATTFSSDTPNWVTEQVRKFGVAGNWQWWAFVLTGVPRCSFSRGCGADPAS